MEAYSKFLHSNLIAEMKAEFPFIDKIINEIQQKNYGLNIEYKKFKRILVLNNVDSLKIDEFIKSLFEKDYMFAYIHKGKALIGDYNTFIDKLNEKKFWFFRKYKISLIIHPDEAVLRHKMRDSLFN